jgi:type II secretory pathway pseudopilin PulG
MKQKKTNFTLLELLVVMGISLILLAISAPAFLSMSKGQSVEVAARVIGSELNAARSYAITHRKSVALIIPIDNNPSGLSSSYYYKSYRTCIVDNIHYQYCDFVEWIDGEKWEFLPTGTAILDVDTTSGHSGAGAGNFLAGGSNQGIRNVDLSSIGGNVDTDGLRAIVFLQTGKTSLRTGTKYVTVGDAVLLESGVTSSSNQIDIQINGNTGKISYPDS